MTSLTARVRNVGVRAGLLPYRRPYELQTSVWDRDYGRGKLDFYGDLDELARYSILVGYVKFLGRGQSILDVGCGVGLLRERLEGVEFGRYLGIDPSAAAIESAGHLADDRTSFAVAEASVAELGQFDVVVCNEVLYVVPDTEALLDQIHQLVRPGGHLLTSIWRHSGDVALHRWLDSRFELADAVELRSLTRSGRRWRLACHRRST